MFQIFADSWKWDALHISSADPDSWMQPRQLQCTTGWDGVNRLMGVGAVVWIIANQSPCKARVFVQIVDIDNPTPVLSASLMVAFRIYFITNYGRIARTTVWANTPLDALASGYKPFDTSWGNDNIIYIRQGRQIRWLPSRHHHIARIDPQWQWGCSIYSLGSNIESCLVGFLSPGCFNNGVIVQTKPSCSLFQHFVRRTPFNFWQWERLRFLKSGRYHVQSETQWRVSHSSSWSIEIITLVDPT